MKIKLIIVLLLATAVVITMGVTWSHQSPTPTSYPVGFGITFTPHVG
jgi:hypothetical protein